MNKSLIWAALCLWVFSCTSVNEEQNQRLSYGLVWSDEFDFPVSGSPDATKWNITVGDGCPHICGWGNNELQYYTDKSENVRVENGKLILQLHADSIGTRGFSSGKITSKGKGFWKYGKIEVKAKLPSTLGSWPAIWMMPEERRYGNWPQCGEIDIMENVGYNPDSVLSTVHTGSYNHQLGTQKGGIIYLPDCDEEFHVYSLEWKEDLLKFFVDDTEIFTYDNEKKTSDEWPFDQPFHLILNIAFGGNWGGLKGVDASELPIQMEIDYVRVYQYL